MLADADEHDAGIASAVNNALARTAGLLATAAVGAVLAGFYADRLDSELAGRALTPAAQEQVVQARDRALGPVDPGALPPADRAVVTEAVRDAGVEAFHLAAVIGGAMLVFAGLLGGLLLRNPRRPTSAGALPRRAARRSARGGRSRRRGTGARGRLRTALRCHTPGHGTDRRRHPADPAGAAGRGRRAARARRRRSATA